MMVGDAVAPRCARPPGVRGRLHAPQAARGLSGVAAYSLQKFIVTDDKSSSTYPIIAYPAALHRSGQGGDEFQSVTKISLPTINGKWLTRLLPALGRI